MTLKKRIWIIVSVIIMIAVPSIYAQSWDCEILPSEHKFEQDAKSGAELIYITTSKAKDSNLYFHDRCWLLDGKMMLFYSDRSGRNELYGYIAEMGNL